jgi:hypothetical protein
VRKRLSTPQNLGGEAVPAIQAVGWPVITYAQSISIHWNGEEIKVIHFPNGHTDGDSVIWFTGSNVLHMGDDFFAARFPFVDMDSGGSVEGLTANIAKVLTMVPDDVKIIPGHGPLSTKADLKAYHRMLIETTAVVKKGMAAGKSLDALKKAGLPAEWKNWEQLHQDRRVDRGVHEACRRSQRRNNSTTNRRRAWRRPAPPRLHKQPAPRARTPGRARPGVGRDAVPRLTMCPPPRPAAMTQHAALDPRGSARGAPPDRVPLQRPIPHRLPYLVERLPPIDRQHVDRQLAHPGQQVPAAVGVVDERHSTAQRLHHLE